MRSLPDDRTSRARIRDEALRLFGAHGPSAVTVRDIAAAAGVSPALVLRHYGSKAGLRDAVDEHVATVFGLVLKQVTEPAGGESLDPASVPSLAEAVHRYLPDDSAIPAYLARMLLAGGPAGSALFRRMHAASREALTRTAQVGAAEAGADLDVRAAFLLINDLAMLMLRPRLHEVLGVDPLSVAGMRRWEAEVLTIYQSGLGTHHTPATRSEVCHDQ